jgi:hypothetical protein
LRVENSGFRVWGQVHSGNIVSYEPEGVWVGLR